MKNITPNSLWAALLLIFTCVITLIFAQLDSFRASSNPTPEAWRLTLSSPTVTPTAGWWSFLHSPTPLAAGPTYPASAGNGGSGSWVSGFPTMSALPTFSVTMPPLPAPPIMPTLLETPIVPTPKSKKKP